MKTKRILAVILSVLMLLSVVPMTASAAAVVKSGTCGTNVTYTLDSDGVLTIAGTGGMTNYSSSSSVPWYSNRNAIKNVVIEDGVTTIGNSAFEDCGNLKNITIPDSVTSIGSYAFDDCHSLTSVTIPDSVTSIGSYAFRDCITLTSVTIPDNVTSIGHGAFVYCTSLVGISVDADNTAYCSEDGVLFNKSKTELIQYPVRKARTSYTIPDSVTSIGEGAFRYCTSLTDITVDADNTTYCSEDGVLFNKSKTELIQYPVGNARRIYTIPDSVTSIGEFAFYYCTSLFSVTIPDSVTSIGDWAFGWCISLTSVTILNPTCEIYDSSATIDDGAVIYGYTNSTAQAYAEKYNRTFVALDPHTHSYTSIVTTPATHLTEGVETFTCECGDTYTKPVAKLADHDYKAVVTAPTCTAQGYTTYTCECGDSYVADYVEIIDHNYVDGICTECGGIADEYIAIYTKEDLDNIRNNLGGNYILMNDLVFSDADFAVGGDYYNDGMGWVPIGGDFSAYNAYYYAFTGTFNGNGYTIKNVKMNRTPTSEEAYNKTEGSSTATTGTHAFGLFARNAGTIKNLNLVVDYKINAKPYAYAGGICGTNAGIISNCNTSGSIFIEKPIDRGDSCFGGIAGSGGSNSTITYCSNAIDISGINTNSFPYLNCGGIVGSAGGTISYCYNTGDITPDTASRGYLGGITGRAGSLTIENCYNAGTVGTTDYVGKIAGICAEYRTNSTTLINCYNAGTILANETTSGIACAQDSKTKAIDHCYYLNTSADYSVYLYVYGTTFSDNVLSASQMKTEEAFAGFDFDNVWIVDAKDAYPYPQLRGNLQSETAPERHTYTQEITKEATCTENGIKKHTCIDCGFTLDVDINATGHSYDDGVVTAPTCTDRGFTTYTCECGDTYIADYVDVIPHEYTSEITTPATHLTEGVETYTCECGDTYTKPVAKFEGHTYTSVVTAPTCTAQGYTTYTCACGDSYVADYTDKLDHSYTSEITTPATHLTEGVETFTCECGDTYTETIEKIADHDYKAVVTAPTCTAQGYTTYTCTICGDTYVADYKNATGHSHKATVTTPATHTATGLMTYTCACGDTYTETIAKITDHTYSKVVTAPTCTAQGYTTYTCECGDSYVADYKNATGHNHKATVTTPATHLATGLMTYTCACGDTYTEIIDKVAKHEYKSEVTTPATHLTTGLKTYTCPCGDTYTEVIAKTAKHTYDYYDIYEATCTESGKRECYCECGHTYVETIPATGHHDGDGDAACDDCGEFYCTHMCHKSGFMGFIWKIVRFFWQLFGMNPVCECGRAHY